MIAVIKDIESDEVWSRNLDDAIRSVFPMETALLYGGRDSFKQYYSGKFPHTNITDGVLSLDSESGTASRTKIAREDPVSSVDFRKGIIYSTQQQYPKVFPTVDAAIVCSRPSDKTMMILMGRKPGEESWRLPGGFVDPEDRSYEDACRRELIEETGYEVDKLKLHYLGSYRQNDWRYRKTDRITTMLFTSLVQCQSDEHLLSAKAGDDLKDLAWLPLARGEYKVNPVHAHLYEAVLDHYGME